MEAITLPPLLTFMLQLVCFLSAKRHIVPEATGKRKVMTVQIEVGRCRHSLFDDCCNLRAEANSSDNRICCKHSIGQYSTNMLYAHMPRLPGMLLFLARMFSSILVQCTVLGSEAFQANTPTSEGVGCGLGQSTRGMAESSAVSILPQQDDSSSRRIEGSCLVCVEAI